jgi:ComF family protein
MDHNYDVAVAVGIYHMALAASVLQLKHSPRLSPILRRLIASRLKNSLINADVVLPIPLSAKRRIERGFNQAEVIAEYVAKVIGAEYKPDSLRRKLHADRNRAMMDRKARELTVRNAFEVANRDDIDGKKVLVVDDVLTSGATVSACAKVLKRNGAASVTVFTLARAV